MGGASASISNRRKVAAADVQLSASVPDDTTIQERAQHLFREFDIKYQGYGPGSITLSEFRDGLTRLNAGFTEDTEYDLFQKLRGTEDTITCDGFQDFADWYPTVLNCLYFRAKDYWNDVRQRQVIARDQQRLQELLETAELARLAAEEAARNQHEAAHRAVEAERAARNAVDAAGGGAESAPTSTKTALELAHRDTLLAREGLSGALEQLEENRDMERGMMQRLELDHARQEIENAEIRVTEADADTEDARDRVKQLEELLQTMREECDRRAEVAENCRRDLAAAQDTLRCMAQGDPVLDALKLAEERVAVAEGELQRRQEEEEAVADAHCTAIALTEQTRDEAAASAKGAEEAERDAIKKKDGYQRALRVAEDLHGRIAEMEQTNGMFNDNRRQREIEERDVLVQEVKLREQRECLEQMEAVLRDRAGHIVQQAATMPTPTGPQWRDIDRAISGGMPRGGVGHDVPEHTPSKPAPLPGRSDYDDVRRLTYLAFDHVGEPSVLPPNTSSVSRRE